MREATGAETVFELTESGAVLGTTSYMSPEQLRGERLDPRTDVLSLGCVLYEMLIGRRPFARESAAGTIATILHDPPPLDAVDAPPELLRIVRKCLEKDKERRYQTARDLLVDIRNLKRDRTSGVERAVAAPAPRRFLSKAYLPAAALVVVGVIALARQLEQITASNMVWAHLLARVHLALGDPDRALDWMARALDAGAIPIFYQQSPLWDPVRGDPRFASLLRRMGVPAGR